MIISNIHPIYRTNSASCQAKTSPNFVDYLQHELAKLNEKENGKETRNGEKTSKVSMP